MPRVSLMIGLSKLPYSVSLMIGLSKLPYSVSLMIGLSKLPYHVCPREVQRNCIVFVIVFQLKSKKHKIEIFFCRGKKMNSGKVTTFLPDYNFTLDPTENLQTSCEKWKDFMYNSCITFVYHKYVGRINVNELSSLVPE